METQCLVDAFGRPLWGGHPAANRPRPAVETVAPTSWNRRVSSPSSVKRVVTMGDVDKRRRP